MAKYLMAGEGFKMRCKDSVLIENLIEMYTYHFKQAREMNCGIEDGEIQDVDVAYAMGKAHGAVDTLSAILLFVLGGKEFYRLWQKTLQWAGKPEKEDK